MMAPSYAMSIGGQILEHAVSVALFSIASCLSDLRKIDNPNALSCYVIKCSGLHSWICYNR